MHGLTRKKNHVKAAPWCPNMTIEKIKIRGIKINSDVAEVDCQDMDSSIPGALLLLKRLSQNQINALSVSSLSAGSRFHSYFYFSHKDMKQVRELIGGPHEMTPPVKITQPVGMISLFPHDYSLKIFGTVLTALGQAAVAPLSISSSLSTLAIAVPLADLDRSLEAILSHFVV